MMKDFFDKTHCDRCGAAFTVTGSTLSKFNLDAICLACKADERQAPGYAQADAAELAAVRAGDYNFPGVGLSVTDRLFLVDRLRQRRQK